VPRPQLSVVVLVSVEPQLLLSLEHAMTPVRPAAKKIAVKRNAFFFIIATSLDAAAILRPRDM